MTKPNDGGPAFPRCNEIHEGIDYGAGGMSLLAWLAGQALPALIEKYEGTQQSIRIAEWSVAYADEVIRAIEEGMIAELETGHGD